MYVKRTAMPEHFPANYSGNLTHGKENEDCEEIHNTESAADEACISIPHKYKVKKNSCRKRRGLEPLSLFGEASSDDILLLGLLIFLYVGCEHSRENLILMGIIAYLLFGARGC